MSGLQPPLFPPPWAAAFGVDQLSPFPFTELELAPEVLMRLRWVPPGRFLMGSPKDERGRSEDEALHWVTLTRGFWLGEAPCTQEEWEAVMGENPSGFKDAGDRRATAMRPVEQVSWEDCQRFCERVNERYPGLGARLPTEAEWEHACRAGTNSAYNDGSDCTDPTGKDPALLRLGWFRENSGATEKHRRTYDVKELEPNAWGLYDMHGNVWEWCGDWYGPYAEREETDPRGPAEGQVRVIRGGCWDSTAGYCRSAQRSGFFPDWRRDDQGFRLLAGQPGEPSESGKSDQEGAEPPGEPSAGRVATRSGAKRP